MNENDFESRLQAFIDGANNLLAEGYPGGNTIVKIRRRGGKYLALDKFHDGESQSVFCFIASMDTATKGLGEVKKGDVLKAAGYKAPARHARGNIFDDHNGLEHVSCYGPAYLA